MKPLIHLLSLSLLCMHGLPITYALPGEQPTSLSKGGVLNPNAEAWPEETPWVSGTNTVSTKDVWERRNNPERFSSQVPFEDLESDRRTEFARNTEEPEASFADEQPEREFSSANPEGEVASMQAPPVYVFTDQEETFETPLADLPEDWNCPENIYGSFNCDGIFDEAGFTNFQDPCAQEETANLGYCREVFQEENQALCQMQAPAAEQPCQEKALPCAPKAYCQSKGLPKLRPLTVVAGIVVAAIVAVVLINSSKTHHHHGKCKPCKCSD